MKKMRVSLVVMAFLFVFGLQSAIADTEVSGNITSDTTWTVEGSPYIVVGIVTVYSGAKLTIEPDVTVKFDGEMLLQIIDGALIARGTETDSIIFTSNKATPQPGDWGSIRFLNNSVDAVLDTLGNYLSGCIIEYCRIEYGGDIPGASYDGAIRCDQASPFISYNLISGDSGDCGGGICCLNQSSPTITNNTITGNSGSPGGGIYLNSSNPTINNNTITGNSANSGGGVYCKSGSSPAITNNTITGNSVGDWGGGVCCTDGSSPTIINNAITRNSASMGGAGIFCGASSHPTISGNTITGNSAGGGIYCRTNSSPTINFNNLVNNGNYEIYLVDDNNIDATNNWWGTTNTDSIDARIYDYYDDIALGKVLHDPILTSPAMGEPDSVYSVVLKSDETYTSDLTTDLWIGAMMYIQLVGEDGDSICVNQTTATITSDSTDTLGIRVALTETDSISGIFRGTALIDTVSVEGVSIEATVGKTVTITSTLDSTKFTMVVVGDIPHPFISNLDIGGSEDIDHLVTHDPIITWSYSDPGTLAQAAFQVQAGTDEDWAVAEIWDSGEVSSVDTFVTYAGDSLVDGETYYLRAKVKNSGALWSSWANLSFRMNGLPTIPIGLSPYHDQVLGDSIVTLIVCNSTDAEGDTLTYSFVVYVDTLTDSVVTSVTGVQEGTDSTGWQIDVPLEEEWPYWWRARAYDGFEYGEWMALRSFIVNTEWSPPVIKSITDVLNDQGRQVTVSWYASEYDAPGDTVTITEYCLWRRIDNLGVDLSGKEAKEDDIPSLESFPPGDWQYVLTVPACGQEVYHCIAPTLCDSTVDGVCWSVFFISAMTPEPLIYFASEIDSGYSVDNLAPSTPQGLKAASGDTSIDLIWGAIPDEDFRYYAVYRGTESGFTPDSSNLLGVTIDNVYSDPDVLSDSTYYYRVSAFDFVGNESQYSDEVICRFTSIRVNKDMELPKNFSLSQNYPNPFNPITEIRYALPAISGQQIAIRLEVFNILGEKVATLVDEKQPPGYKAVTWDASGVASGIYLYRLQAGGFAETRRMMLIR